MMIDNFTGISLSPITAVEELQLAGMSPAQCEEAIASALEKFQFLRRLPGMELREWLVKNGADAKQLAKLRLMILSFPVEEKKKFMANRRGYFSPDRNKFYSSEGEQPDLDQIIADFKLVKV